jgi:hypothetical protein
MTKKKTKAYGFVLVLRGLARAAILLSDHPAALRVLCIAAEYMNQEGICQIGQGTIAARLDVSRQAVNKHLLLLDRLEILIADAKKGGVTLRYYLNTDGLDDERAGQNRVDERRAAKRRASEGKASQAMERPEDIRARQASGVFFIHERIGWRAFSDAELDGGDMATCLAAMEAAEIAQGVEYREVERIGDSRAFRIVYVNQPPLTIVPQAEPVSETFAVYDRVSHVKFGSGTVQEVDGNKISVFFDLGVGVRKVIASFINHAPTKGATSEIARGATQ